MSRTGTTTFSDFLKNYGLYIVHYQMYTPMMMGVGDGSSDIPVLPYYKELHKMRPDSKFVHLTRENWIDAVEPYFERKMSITSGDTPEKMVDFLGLPQKGYSFPVSNARDKTWEK